MDSEFDSAYDSESPKHLELLTDLAFDSESHSHLAFEKESLKHLVFEKESLKHLVFEKALLTVFYLVSLKLRL